jgi:LuxR family maltose regulon positive regulatory protein
MDARAFLAWLALRQGRRAEARHWAESVADTMPLQPLTTFHVAIMTLAKILSLQEDSVSLRKASDLLARVSRYTESQCVTRFTLEVRALQALVADSLGDSAAARLALHEALALAEPGGFVRVFVDLGPRMAQLLARLGNPNGTPGYADRILRAFPPADTKGLSLSMFPHPNQSALIEPLTNRELEILALLAERLSAKEIAQRLVISDRTAKRHTANIYQKLGVSSRREAVEVARALGILQLTQPS